MQITDLLAQMGGLQSIARELGVSEDQAAAGASALAPAVLGGFQKQLQDGTGAPQAPGGAGGLGGLLAQLGGGGLLDQVLAPQPTDTRQGDAVLGQIFGSKDVSRAVAQNAAQQSGLAPDLLKKMLPLLAMLLAGYVARQQGGGAAAPAGAGLGGAVGGGLGGGLGGLLGSVLGGGAPAASGGAAGGLGGLASLLDANGDGNALDDILRMAGKALR